MEQLVSAGTPIQEVTGIGARTIEKLVEHGITTVERLGEMTPEQLQEIQGIGPKMVEKIRLAVNNYYMQFEETPEGVTAESVPAKGGETQPVVTASAPEANSEQSPQKAKDSGSGEEESVTAPSEEEDHNP